MTMKIISVFLVMKKLYVLNKDVFVNNKKEQNLLIIFKQ